MVLALRVPDTENLVPLCSRLSSTASTSGIVVDVNATTRGVLDGGFHGEGVLRNRYFRKDKTYACWGIWANYDHEWFPMLYVQPNGVTIRLGLTYEGHFENGMRHGRGILTLRPFTPYFLSIIIYDGE